MELSQEAFAHEAEARVEDGTGEQIESHHPESSPELIRFEKPVVQEKYPRLRLHRQFPSAFLSARRDVMVALPPDYGAADCDATDPHSTGRRYPVLYLQDGQNLFDGEASFIKGRTWDVQSTVDRLVREAAIEPLIVVGIYNTGVDRMDEYTPMRDPKLGGGQAHLYGRLMVEELKPWIDAHYRTLPGPAHTGVGGSSLGGLVSLYLGLSWPNVFGRLAVLSPSIWWGRGGMLQYVRNMRPEPRPRIWLDIGLAEGATMVERCDALHRLLVRRGWREGVDLRYLRVPDGKHDELAWAERVEPFLRFLFPAEQVADGSLQE
jgi:enterochelin esterase-like enzyme